MGGFENEYGDWIDSHDYSSSYSNTRPNIQKPIESNQPSDIARFEKEMWEATEKKLINGWPRDLIGSAYGNIRVIYNNKYMFDGSYGSPMICLVLEKCSIPVYHDGGIDAARRALSIQYSVSVKFVSSIFAGYSSAQANNPYYIDNTDMTGYRIGKQIRSVVSTLLPT